MQLNYLLIVSLALLLLQVSATNTNNYHAAKCLARRRACSSHLAALSAVCQPGLTANRQPNACHVNACAWCKIPDMADKYPCTEVNIVRICYKLDNGLPVIPPNKLTTRNPTTTIPTTRTSTTTRRTTTRATTRRTTPRTTTRRTTTRASTRSERPRILERNCVWTGDNSAVANVGAAKPATGWEKITKHGLTGMIYEKDLGEGIHNPEPDRTMCFPMKVAQSGDYYLTGLTAAPHPTEHNDMWISSSLGFELLRHGDYTSVANGVFKKAYENVGHDQIADYLHTVDFNGHIFIIPNVQSGAPFEICISGRSFKYEVYKLIVAKCNSALCRGGKPDRNYKNMPDSSCI